MLWIKAFHIISMILWFSGLFYLPRIFVYHATTQDKLLSAHFLRMEKALFYGVMTPGAVLTLIFGFILLYLNWANDISKPWMHLKLLLVLGLIAYHIYLGYLLKCFERNKNHHSHTFYRWLNELPTLALLAIIILVIVKPNL